MRPQTLKTFVQLCEGLMLEASSSMAIAQKFAGGKEVVQALHQQHELSHEQQYSEIPKISWNDLKGPYRGTWVLIQGTKGFGAIKCTGGTTADYYAVASTGGEVRKLKDSRGGNIIDFLKGEIGNLRKFYFGRNSTDVSDKKRKRSELSAKPEAGRVTTDTLVTKFRPLWVKAITTSIADIKGHIANQIKNDAFEKAKHKLERVQQLQTASEELEAGSTETPGFIKTAVHTAVLMAAHHYYPETTGEIQRGYSRSYSSTHSEGPAQLLQDITKGDTAKLGTILAFFKRTLISG